METVKEVLKLIGFYQYITPIITAFIIAMGFVYLIGRMFLITENYRIKNIISFVAIAGWTTLEYLKIIPQTINNILIVSCGAFLLYVLVGFRLYDRFNKFQDDRFAFIDENGKEITLTKKRKSKKS